MRAQYCRAAALVAVFVALAAFAPATAADATNGTHCAGFTPAAPDTGVASNATAFTRTTTATAAECCAFCQAQGDRCVAWTFHPDTSLCAAADEVTPHHKPHAVSATRAPAPPLGFQPNIVFVLTDDQDRTLGGHDDYTPLGSVESMAAVQQLLMREGAFFDNFYVNTPVCCPSRTEFLTGRMYHNIHVAEGGCMHVTAGPNVFNASVGVFSLMQAAGYNTGVFGKVTNEQGKGYWNPKRQSSWLSQGMTHINSPTDYNDFNANSWMRKFANGTMAIETLGASPPFGTTYQTAQLGNRSIEWLDEVIDDKDGKPFFAYIGPHAPHWPAEPAPWHAHLFDDTLRAPRTPNYNVSSPDKAQHIRQNPPLNDEAACWIDQHMRDRWASLQSVDDVVRAVYDKLSAAGVLNETFIIYSSDHGFKLGQYRLGTAKQHPFQMDVHVPFIVRGPGVAPGSHLPPLASNIDLAPTLLDLAGAPRPNLMDGKSMLPFLVPSARSAAAAAAAARPGATPLIGAPTARRISASDFNSVAAASAANAGAAPAWRDRLLIEYQSVGNLQNDHGPIWHDATSGPTGKWACGPGTTGPKSPTPVKNCVEESGVGDGECWFTDSEASNTWRALRIINATSNLVYVEYDPTWTWNATDPSGAGLQHYELYDIAADPFQMTNLYASTTLAQRTELHTSIAQYYACRGTDTAPSNCL